MQWSIPWIRPTRPSARVVTTLARSALLLSDVAAFGLGVLLTCSMFVFVTGAKGGLGRTLLVSLPSVLVVVLTLTMLLHVYRLPLASTVRPEVSRTGVALMLAGLASGSALLLRGNVLISAVEIGAIPFIVIGTALAGLTLARSYRLTAPGPATTPPVIRDGQLEASDLTSLMQTLAGRLAEGDDVQHCRLFMVSSDGAALVLRGEAGRDGSGADRRRLPRERIPVQRLLWLERLLIRSEWLHVPADVVQVGGTGSELTRGLASELGMGDVSLRAIRVSEGPVGVVCIAHAREATAGGRMRRLQIVDHELAAWLPSIERALRLRALGVNAATWWPMIRELPYGVVVVNRGTRVIAVNAAAEEALRPLACARMGWRLCENLHGCACPLHTAVRTGERLEVAATSLWPDLPEGSVPSAWVRPIAGREGEYDLIVISLSRSAPPFRADIAAMISHELRVPLATLRASSELAMDEDADPERQRHLLTVISRQVDRLDHLVQDLGDIFRLQSGSLELERQPVDLYVLCQDLIEDCEAGGTTHSIRLIRRGDLRPVAADLLKVRTVLSNLVMNAIKYTPADTVITVTVKAEGGGIRASVADEGQGIPEEELPFLFDQFYRSPATSRAIKGHGLGLYIAKSLVEMHGGEIRVESTPGLGSRFTVWLPFDPPVTHSTKSA